MAERKIWIERTSTVAAVIATLSGLIAGALTYTKLTKIDVGGIRVAIPTPESAVSRKIADLVDDVSVLKVQVAELTKVPQSVAVSAKLQELDAKLTALDAKMIALHNAIMASPEKALEVPMLRRDLLALQNQYESATRSLEREITRAYDTIKWVIGTIVLGILGLAAGVFLRGKQG